MLRSILVLSTLLSAALCDYDHTRIQLVSKDANLNGQYLRVESQGDLPFDVGSGPVKDINEATRFFIPARLGSDFYEPMQAKNNSQHGPVVGKLNSYVDDLAPNSPVYWSDHDQTVSQPNFNPLHCNTVSDPKEENINRVLCASNGSNIKYKFSRWAICDFVNNSRGDLFLWDASVYGDAGPKYCTEVELLVLDAPH